MPELPEVEILVRHLAPLLKGRTIRDVRILRPRAILPTTRGAMLRKLRGAIFEGLERRGKYLLFSMRAKAGRDRFLLVGHLGMTGRMYLVSRYATLPKHAAVTFDLGSRRFVYEDVRGFGSMNLDSSRFANLGPEPFSELFSDDYFAAALRKSSRPIKVKLLDQGLVAGIGNIYASEALFHARLSPRVKSNRLSAAEVQRLRVSILEVLARAINCGSTLSLDFAGESERETDGFFYYGSAGMDSKSPPERLLVYDRTGKSCFNCGTPIQRFVQAARSTFHCPRCQRLGH